VQLEERCKSRDRLIDMLRRVAELHVICAYDDMELLILAGAAFQKIVLIHWFPALSPATINKGWVRNTSALVKAS